MPRTARSVSAALRAAGIPVGYRYTQTGYVDRDRRPATALGCEVTRNKTARYGGMEDRGHVAVFPINPANPGIDVPAEFLAAVVAALTAAGLPLGRASALSVEVQD